MQKLQKNIRLPIHNGKDLTAEVAEDAERYPGQMNLVEGQETGDGRLKQAWWASGPAAEIL